MNRPALGTALMWAEVDEVSLSASVVYGTEQRALVLGGRYHNIVHSPFHVLRHMVHYRQSCILKNCPTRRLVYADFEVGGIRSKGYARL